MNKIIKALLETKYPTLNIESLLMVINATPNGEIATEILCGLYVKPEVNNEPKEGFSKEKVNIKFKSFNDFKQEVEYTYNQVETKTVWIIKGSNKPNYTDEGLITAYWEDDAAKKLSITKEELKAKYEKVLLQSEPSKSVYTDTTALTNWQ